MEFSNGGTGEVGVPEGGSLEEIRFVMSRCRRKGRGSKAARGGRDVEGRRPEDSEFTNATGTGEQAFSMRKSSKNSQSLLVSS